MPTNSPLRKQQRRGRRLAALRSDEGITLVEMLISLTILSIIMGTFFLVYLGFAASGTSTVNYAQQQGAVRNVFRILTSDLRSADPLTVVPSSFTSAVTLPSGTVTSSGTNGTTPTDVIAMYENDDEYAACGAPSTTTTTLPTPFLSSNFSANVVWAYNKTVGTLSRYSYVAANPAATSTLCQNGGWIVDETVLTHVTNANGTMFTISQGTSTLQTQNTTPSSTTVVNQAAPACGTSVAVLISAQNVKGGQTFSFKVQSSVPLPNQPGVMGQAC